MIHTFTLCIVLNIDFIRGTMHLLSNATASTVPLSLSRLRAFPPALIVLFHYQPCHLNPSSLIDTYHLTACQARPVRQPSLGALWCCNQHDVLVAFRSHLPFPALELCCGQRTEFRRDCSRYQCILHKSVLCKEVRWQEQLQTNSISEVFHLAVLKKIVRFPC